MQTLDANAAGSSPAESTAPPATAFRSLDSLSASERDSWRLTGKMPDAAPVTTDTDGSAESSPAEPAAQAASTDASDQAASEPAAAGKKKGVKARNEELDAEIAALNDKLRQRAMLRAQVEQVEAPAPPASDVSAGSSPGAAAEDFPSFDEWAAKPANAGQPYERYVRELARHEYRAEQQQQQRVQAVQTRVEQFRTRVTQAAQADPNLWAELAPEVVNLRPIDDLGAGERPTPLNVLAQEIVQSEHAPALLRHFSKDRAALARVASMSFADVVREVGRLEARLSTPVAPATPVIPVSKAPDPPARLGSKPTAPTDEVDGAIARRDFAAFRDAQNRREMGR